MVEDGPKVFQIFTSLHIYCLVHYLCPIFYYLFLSCNCTMQQNIYKQCCSDLLNNLGYYEIHLSCSEHAM